MNDDDDIAATLGALPDPAGAAPKSDEEDIAGTLSSLDRPARAAPDQKIKTLADLSKMTFAQKVMHWESGGDANAKSPTSSATGAGQFINTTWLPTIKKHRPDLAAGKSDAELLAMRNDPQLSEQMIDAHGADNAEKLKANGIPVSDASKYGAHWFGADKLAQITKADPKTPIEDIIGKDAAANNGLAGKSADDVKTLLAKRMGGDYMPQAQGWGDALSQAGSNFLPSVGHMAAGVYQSVRHPADTFHTLKQIAVGLDSKVRGYAGEDQKPEDKAKDEALVDALGASYKEKYGTIDGFKQYLAHDPAGVLFDASTVLSGGGGLAAKLPGIAGKAGEVVGAVGKAVNPLNPMGAVSGTVKKLTMPAAAVDKAGNITPKVDALIKKVTDNNMSAADLADPAVKAYFVETVGKKGVSEASVREGLLRSLGLKAPTSVTEGTAPPHAAAETTVNAVNANNQSIAAKATQLRGAPSTSSLGEALDNAHTQSINNASAQYDAIRNMPGSFGKQMPELGQFGRDLKARFDKSGIPTADLASMTRSGYPKTAEAVRLMRDYWGKGTTLMKNGVGEYDASEILAMRKALNNLRGDAQGSDIKGMSDVIKGFDQHISSLSNRGFYVGPNGRPVQGLAQQISKANAAYKAHFDTFETRNGSNNAVVNAVDKLKSKQSRNTVGDLMPSGDQDLYTQAQGTIATDLLHPAKGPATYNNLAKALGTSTPIDEHLKGLLSDPETKGARELLNSNIGKKAFAGSPDDLAMAKHLHAAHAINNTKPSLDARGASVLKSVLGSVVGKGVGTVAGYEALGGAGLVVGPMIEHLLEKGKDAYQRKAALAGARPTHGWARRTVGSTARRVTNPLALAAEHYENQAQEIGRASGGKVDEDTLVNRLIQRWKHAKRSTDKTTEPLLHIHDDVIAKALHIAQRNI